MSSLFRCCAGNRRQKHTHQPPEKLSDSSATRFNSHHHQQQQHDVATSGDEVNELSTPYVQNSDVTSTDDQFRFQSKFPRSDMTCNRSPDNKPARRVCFTPPVVSPDRGATSNESSDCRASPNAAPDADVFNGPDEDYDNTSDGRQISCTTSVTDSRLIASPKTSSGQVTPRKSIKSSEEESLDQLVAHLLGEVTPTEAAGQLSASDCSGVIDNGRQHQQQLDVQSSCSALRWPQGDSLPRVDMRAAVRNYDVPTAGHQSQLRADENDNVIKSTVESREVMGRPTGSAPVGMLNTPPLATIRKKLTTDPAESALLTDSKQSAELNRQLHDTLTSDSVEEKLRDHGYSVPSSRNTKTLLHSEIEMTSVPSDGNLTEQELSRLNVQTLSSESDSKSFAADVPVRQATTTNAESDLPTEQFSVEVQQMSLLEQFKLLRLQVLTSTSQLLSCVSGTWKRGESFRSKLTTITQLCLTLRTSVAKLETFLQFALLSARDADSPEVKTASTRIRNLQAIQASIDAYVDTLDGEVSVSSAMTGKQDLKVGGIIHLTKEIPGLVRTFAPAVEYLTALNDVSSHHGPDVPVAKMDDADRATDKSQVQPAEKPFSEDIDNHIDMEMQPNKGKSEITNGKTNTNLNLTQESTDIFKVVESFPIENEQEANPAVCDDFQQVSTNASTVHSNTPTYVCNINSATDTVHVSVDERAKVDHNGSNSEVATRAILSPPPPPVPDPVDSPPPPTPPPKLRVASRYHASLGITNSLTVEAADSSKIKPQRNLDVKHSLEERKLPDDFEPSANATRRQTDDCAGKFEPQKVSVTSVIDYMSGCQEEVITGADSTHFRFPRAAETESCSGEPVVVLRRPTEPSDVKFDGRRYRVSESELETPDFRVSGVSQTMVDQLEELQRDANAVAVLTHTNPAAGYELIDAAAGFINSPCSPCYQSSLSACDQRLLMFYCSQMTGNWNVLDHAASAFFHCMDRRQPPKVFVSHSKFVIVAGHKMAYLGDVLARNVADDNAQNWIVAHSNRLCNSLKLAVRATKEAALAYPDIPVQQMMVDCVKDVTDWAIELKEVVDRLAYLGRPDHVLA